MTVEWQPHWPKPDVPTLMAEFTGFGPGGNGYALLSELHDRGIMAVRDGDDIRLHAGARQDTHAKVGDLFCQEPDNTGVYPIRRAVYEAKYTDQRPQVPA